MCSNCLQGDSYRLQLYGMCKKKKKYLFGNFSGIEWCSQTRDFRRLACGNNNEADFLLGSFLQELVPPWDPRLCPATQSRLLMRNYPYGGDRGVNELSRCPVSPRSFLIHTKMKSRPFPWVVESPRPLRHIWTSERLVFLPFRFSVSVSPVSFFTWLIVLSSSLHSPSNQRQKGRGRTREQTSPHGSYISDLPTWRWAVRAPGNVSRAPFSLGPSFLHSRTQLFPTTPCHTPQSFVCLRAPAPGISEAWSPRPRPPAICHKPIEPIRAS